MNSSLHIRKINYKDFCLICYGICYLEENITGWLQRSRIYVKSGGIVYEARYSKMV